MSCYLPYCKECGKNDERNYDLCEECLLNRKVFDDLSTRLNEKESFIKELINDLTQHQIYIAKLKTMLVTLIQGVKR